MDIYIILFVFLLVLALAETNVSQRNKNIMVIASCLVLTFIVGFRTCGVDYFLYEYIFKTDLKNMGAWDANLENGAGFLYLLIGEFVGNYNYLVAIVACISIGAFYYVITKLCERPNCGILFLFVLYFFMSLMMQSRQCCAISLVLVAIYFRSVNWRLSLLFILLAVGFHQTAFLAIIILLCPNRRFQLKHYIMIYFFCIVFRELSSTFLGYLSHIDLYYISHKTDVYMTRQEDNGQFVGLFSTIDFFYFILFYLTHRISNKKDEKINYWINLFFFGLCFRHIFYFMYELSVRGSQYFTSSQLLLLLYLINYSQKSVRDKNTVTVSRFLFLYFLILTYFSFGRTISENANMQIIPYTNYFFNII